MTMSSSTSSSVAAKSNHPHQEIPKNLPPPSLFDMFYEEFLTQLLSTDSLADRVPEEFMALFTDIDRVEYIMHIKPFVQEFEIQTKIGVKSVEKSARFREEGNKLFNADQGAQSVLFYNKALSYAPHPSYEDYQRPPPEERNEESSGVIERKRFEALSLCYANRSAALRKLGQFEDCLKDIARAARFGYPRENLYRLWERKGKCYQGMKRYEMAVKCFRQALQSLKDARGLTEHQKSMKSQEIQAFIKELRTTHFFLGGGAGGIASSMSSDDGTGGLSTPAPGDDIYPMNMGSSGPEPPLMGATGPIVIVPDPEPKRKMSSSTLPPPEVAPHPPKPQRMSFRRKKTVREKASSSPSSPLPQQSSLSSLPNGGEDTSSLGGDSSCADQPSPQPTPATTPTPSSSQQSQQTASTSQASAQPPPPHAVGELRKANSQMSISQLSTTGIKPDIEVPELSYGINHRMPCASSAIDMRITPEKGRHLVAVQDLTPGDVVLREEPYAAVLEAIFRVNHCAYCLKKTATPIPCYQCATVQFCSENCRDFSWVEFHRFECGILGYLEPSRYLGRMPHLALRIITKTGMQNLIQHSMTSLLPTLKNGDQQQQQHQQQQHLPDNNANFVFDSSSYKSVHNLATNTDKRPFEDLIKKTCEAIFMAKCLKFNGFFGEKDTATQDTRRAEIFVSSLLLRHLQIASTNGLEMAECILKNNDVTKFDIIPVGGAIFPTMSFFNHSCYPNALRLGYQNFQVVRIIRTVKKGEEVNIDYGFDFYANPKEVRQKRAQSQYYFTCTCVACTNNWPTYTELVGRPRRLKSQQPLTPDLSEEFERQAAAYQIAMDFLLKLDITTAMPIFRDYLIVMNELVEHPNARYIDCEEAYKQCLWLENRGYKSKVPSASASGPTPGTPTQHHQHQSSASTSGIDLIREISAR